MAESLVQDNTLCLGWASCVPLQAWAGELQLLVLMFARTLSTSNRGYPLPDSVYLPDNQQDICVRIFCFHLSLLYS